MHARRHRSRRAEPPPWRWPAFAAAALAAAVAGFGYAAWRAEARLADALPAAWEGADVLVVGVVDDLPDASERGVRFAFAVERVESAEARVPSRISLSWPSARPGDERAVDVPDLAAGERWRLVVRLKRPHGYANPGGFDLEAWLLERNLRATGYVRAGDANARLDAFAGRFRDHVQRARESGFANASRWRSRTHAMPASSPRSRSATNARSPTSSGRSSTAPASGTW